VNALSNIRGRVHDRDDDSIAIFMGVHVQEHAGTNQVGVRVDWWCYFGERLGGHWFAGTQWASSLTLRRTRLFT